MTTLFEPEARASIRGRIGRLGPHVAPRWGRLSARRMVRHVGDQMRQSMGELEARPMPGPLYYWPLNSLAIHVLPWPRGAPTAPEFLAAQPESWEADVESLYDLIRRFTERGPHGRWPASPVFGRISGKDYGVLVYRHLDHHLTQFGV